MDNHFNPTVSSQCVARAHRYGQEKPVHCYRLAIEGTLETKVYARCVNKTGAASGVIDGEIMSQAFTRAETANLTAIDSWATCSECGKRRLLLPSQEPPEEGVFWTCSENQDKARNDCNAPEEFQLDPPLEMEKSADPILVHLQGVVNSRTRKNALLTLCASVQENSPSADSSVEQNTKRLRLTTV